MAKKQSSDEATAAPEKPAKKWFRKRSKDKAKAGPEKRRPLSPFRRGLLNFFFEDVSKLERGGRLAPLMPKIVPALFFGLLLALIFGWLLFAGLANLAGSHVSYLNPGFGEIKESQLSNLVRSTATVAGVFGGVFAIVYAYRKTRVDEAAGLRADVLALADRQKDFSQRYQDAAEQLGHDKAAVRLAGVYSMARLADDWREQRQTCVDVLCAYLRMPWPTIEGGSEDLGEVQVRSSILKLINAHVHRRKTLGVSWSDRHFDFSYAVLRDVLFYNSVFEHFVSFSGATFIGHSVLADIKFSGDVDFEECAIVGSLTLRTDAPGPAAITLSDLQVTDTAVFLLDLTDVRKGASVGARNMVVKGSFALEVRPSSSEQGTIDLHGLNAGASAVVKVKIRRGMPPIKPPYKLPTVNMSALKTAHGANVDVNEELKSLIDAGLSDEKFPGNEDT